MVSGESTYTPPLPPGAESEEFRSLYPFKDRFFPVGAGASMHYLDEGDGEPLLCLHGNPTWSFLYREVVKHFRPRFRCVVPDHIGCGFSSKPPDYPYRLERHIENVEKLVDHLDLGDITLVLHDWGGAIGMGLARRRPERIKRIVLLNTAAFPSKRIPWRINICRTPWLGEAVIRGLNGFALAAVLMATTRKGGLPGPVRRGFLLPYDSWRNRIALHRFVADIPMSPGHPSYPVLEQTANHLSRFRDVPVLICWGGKDFCFNDVFLEEWKERWPHARIERFANAGHYVLEDAPAEVLGAMERFLV